MALFLWLCRYNQSVSENAVQQIASAEFPTRWGTFRIYGFRAEADTDGGEVEEAAGVDATIRRPGHAPPIRHRAVRGAPFKKPRSIDTASTSANSSLPMS